MRIWRREKPKPDLTRAMAQIQKLREGGIHFEDGSHPIGQAVLVDKLERGEQIPGKFVNARISLYRENDEGVVIEDETNKVPDEEAGQFLRQWHAQWNIRTFGLKEIEKAEQILSGSTADIPAKDRELLDAINAIRLHGGTFVMRPAISYKVPGESQYRNRLSLIELPISPCDPSGIVMLLLDSGNERYYNSLQIQVNGSRHPIGTPEQLINIGKHLSRLPKGGISTTLSAQVTPEFMPAALSPGAPQPVVLTGTR